jgi:hypothetical protein
LKLSVQRPLAWGEGEGLSDWASEVLGVGRRPFNEGRAAAASLVMNMVEQQLVKAKKLVAEFGPNIQMVG